MDLHQLMNIALKASLVAGKKIMEIYNQDFEIEWKEDNSPLTNADLASNEIINSFLKSTNIPVISEENSEISYEKRKNWEYCWIVDPIDGTKEFIKKNGEFTVNISLVKNGKPVIGVIFVPVTKELYYAIVSNKKAFKTKINNYTDDYDGFFKPDDEIKPSSYNSKEIRIVGSRSHMNSETMDFVNQVRKPNVKVTIVSKGSSLKFCLVAEGKADIYPRFAPTMEWDTAAGQAICNAVELDVIDLSANSSMVYNRENLLNNNFLVKRKMDSSYKRHILKTITWRIVGTLDTFILSWIITGNTITGLKISGAELVTKMVLYYFHERTWFKIKVPNSQKRHLLKTITWRVIGTTDTILLAWIITGNPLTGFSIGAVEIISKMILYYLHERIWYKFNFGIENRRNNG